jgi:large subunit ribosomal protein L9
MSLERREFSVSCLGLVGAARFNEQGFSYFSKQSRISVDTTRSASILVTLLPLPKSFLLGRNLNKMPSTQIILTENVPGLGAEADVVKVRRGYARNYLLPRGKAYEVTPASLRQLDNLKKKRAEREARELNDAEELARRIGKSHMVFTLETGETGKAFGSITAQDIMNRLKNELGAEIDRHKIVLEHPIKTTGDHEVAIKLHHDVTARFVFQVKSAEAPPAENAEASAEQSEKKHRSFFRRKKETK